MRTDYIINKLINELTLAQISYDYNHIKSKKKVD